MSERWKIVPIGRNYEYSKEIRERAHAAALQATTDLRFEFVDDAGDNVSKLGQKWKLHFSHAHGELKKKFGRHIDDLILLADRTDKYASVYADSLTQNFAKHSEENFKKIDSVSKELCGTLLAQHYDVACRKELLEGTSLKNFPGTGDLLAALSVNRIMQAALLIESDVKKALDLLSDAMAAKHLCTQGDMRSDSYFDLKNDRKVIGRKGAHAKKINSKMAELKKFAVNLYQEKTWNSPHEAANSIASKVLIKASEIGAKLSNDRAPKTLAEWFRNHDQRI